MAGDSTVAVRMYNVGFGDAFLVTVRRDNTTWRMLVDCGVHSQGQARPIREAVRAIIGDLRAESTDGTAHLDVIVATHHHADHISGFALPDWEEVVVEEVWLPFVEDESDPDAVALRRAQSDTAQRLLWLIDRRTHNLDPGDWPMAVVAAQWFALNSFGNADATDRLVGRNGQHFASKHRVRYLPSLIDEENEITVGIDDVAVHVLGPSRDPDDLKDMDPPKSAGWLELNLQVSLDDDTGTTLFPLFNSAYVVDDDSNVPEALRKAQEALNLQNVTNDAGLLSAASILERAVNNTSLFFVLDVAGTRLLFPGDAQHGAWEHVLNDPRKKAFLVDAAFYKIGHHGSHNATPKRFVEEIWHDGAYAMLPWGLVKRWQDTIPKKELLEALHTHQHTVIRADAPQAEPNRVAVHDDLWSEVVFTTS
ncbi:MAG: hypothetical protein ACRDPJ_10105 [Nocardioidaceae bacterium]